MRPQTVRNEVIACLADDHWWTAGELAQTIDVSISAVRRVLDALYDQSALEVEDSGTPYCFRWVREERGG